MDESNLGHDIVAGLMSYFEDLQTAKHERDYLVVDLEDEKAATRSLEVDLRKAEEAGERLREKNTDLTVEVKVLRIGETELTETIRDLETTLESVQAANQALRRTVQNVQGLRRGPNTTPAA